jgi:DNA-binding MarR family transcriptional regulator
LPCPGASFGASAAQLELATLGLTFPQYSVLSVAVAQSGLSGAELVRDTMLTPQTTNEIIPLLAAADLLERRPDERDKRLRRIDVTPAGRKLVAEARPVVHAVEQRGVRRQLHREHALALFT